MLGMRGRGLTWRKWTEVRRGRGWRGSGWRGKGRKGVDVWKEKRGGWWW